MKKIISVIVSLVIVIFCFTGCTEASKVNHNISKQSQYFECERKITVYNALGNKTILEIEGYMDISNNATDELVVTCKTGANEYKKNYIYLNQFTLYVVEDISGVHTNPYHYKVYFHTDVAPDIEVKP